MGGARAGGVLRRRLRDFRRLFDHGDDWIYGIFTLDGSELIGGGGLHRRVGAEALEIGYWIRASRVRQGLATETAGALTRVAFERCGVIRTEIHVDPANTPQPRGRRPARIRARGGAAPAPAARAAGSGRRDEVVSSLLEEEYAGSPAAAVWVEELAWRSRVRRPAVALVPFRVGVTRGARGGRWRDNRR